MVKTRQNSQNSLVQMEEITAYTDIKFAELKVELTGHILKRFKDEVVVELSKIIGRQNEEIEKLLSTVCMLQEHVKTLKQNSKEKFKKQDEQVEELEQYGRRLCLRIDGIPITEGEYVLDKVKKEWEKVTDVDKKINIPDAVIDRAHRIGPEYFDRDTNEASQSVIIRFTTHRHCTMLYNLRKEMDLKIKFDLTKKRYELLRKARDIVKLHASVDYVYADLNCRLKVKFKNKTQKFFSSLQQLEEILEG